MTMVRTLVTALVLSASFSVMAQKPDMKPVDSPEMIANAKKHMEMVDRSVNLNKEQEAKVQEVYLQVERQAKALAYRMEGQPKTEVDADMRHQYQAMEEYTQHELAKVLTPDQMNRWMEDSK
jgi:arylamine N-acetyltransferase